MKTKTAHGEWLNARYRLEQAQKASGIAEALSELNASNAFIASSEKHAADERAIVFSIEDEDLRRQVIRLYRECHEAMRTSAVAGADEMGIRVRDAGERIRRQGLWTSVLLGASSVIFGAHFWGVIGGLVGAVASVLIGFDQIRRADRQAAADVADAREGLRDHDRFMSDAGTEGAFSKNEAFTGLPDAHQSGA